MLLEDRVAIITGGAMGMGRGIALKFAEHNCSVAIADINLKEAEDALKEIETNGGSGLAIQCDVTRKDQVSDAVGKVIDQFGKIDILVNNAGGISTSPAIEDMTEEEWDEMLSLNLKSHFLLCKFVVPYMKKKRYGNS